MFIVTFTADNVKIASNRKWCRNNELVLLLDLCVQVV